MKLNKEVRLTPREQQVLDYFQRTGASNKHIARYLRLSESTVKLHLANLTRKYGVKGRCQLLAYTKK
ncbi:LuxR family transcriptional regulator [bacterium]|nr:LuxR family transcriptional regulator [bacterium]